MPDRSGVGASKGLAASGPNLRQVHVAIPARTTDDRPRTMSPLSDPTIGVVTVEILGQRYPIRSALDPAYVLQLAGYVDAKMQAAAEESPSADALRVAVVAALNIADEFFRSREAEATDGDAVVRRAADLERLIDRAIAAAREPA